MASIMLATLTPAAAMAGDGDFVFHGTIACAAWTRESMGQHRAAWAEGFLAAMDIAEATTDGDGNVHKGKPYSATSAADIEQRVTSYCMANPREPVTVASIQIYVDILDKAYGSNPQGLGK
ncbi:hypothetical protein [Mesorhizobium australicum]|uniref:hypothetical protein n=1 Tax=Mesorhizobium australicum TaxID=536018 RepID=UPI00333AE67C